MKRTHLFIITLILGGFIVSCGPNSQQTGDNQNAAGNKNSPSVTTDNSKGKGKFTDVQLTHPLDQGMVAKGKNLFDVKCSACHKLTDEKLVGPGWKGVTDRRTPEWIMNFATNTDEMIDKDPTAQALLEKCMIRMPNQHITDEEARDVLEFMRNNDGKS